MIDPGDMQDNIDVATTDFNTAQTFVRDPVTVAPATPPAPPAFKAEPLTYTVRKNDSFWKISRMYGVNQQELASCNNMSLKKTLKVGTVLLIPAGGSLQPGYTPPPPSKNRPTITRRPRNETKTPTTTNAAPTTQGGFYIVKPGDSLWKIAHRNHVSMSALANANNLDKQSVIHPGMRLLIPGAGTTTKPTNTKPLPNAYAPLSQPTHRQPAKTDAGGGVLDDALKAANENPPSENASDVFDVDELGTEEMDLEKAAKIAEEASHVDEYFTEQVLPSDTLDDMARRNGVTVEQLRKLNPQIPQNGKLKPFTELKIRKRQ
jgi:LysM repeat protein